MPRRPAAITQSDIARIVRAARQAGAAEVIIKVGDQDVIVRLVPNAQDADTPLAPAEGTVL